jgi:tetratricopeptide (TPR) repeat protein
MGMTNYFTQKKYQKNSGPWPLGPGLWAIGFILFSTLHLNAQDFKKQYKAAKEFYQDKQYNFAQEAFKPLMVYDKANPYVEYASFYYALSAYHQNYFAVAKEMLRQIQTLYPGWDQQDEVNYWLAAIYFKEGEHFQALRMLYAMKSPRDLSGIERMKNNYLLQLYDEEIVRLILEEFPGEVQLLKRQIFRYVAKGDYDKARELIQANGLDERDFNFPEKKKVVMKDQYRVAALFPFLANTLDPSPGVKRNQSTLDLYSGMRFAVDSLSRLGIQIELVTYDTERKPEAVELLMEQEEMKSVDLLVGPLFPDEVLPVAEFSVINSIPVVNPVSFSNEFVKNNPNAILFQPDYSTLGAAAAEVLHKRKLKKPCIVIYGEAEKDSAMAFSFNKRAEELGLKVVLTRRIERANSALVYNTLVDPTKFDKFRNPIEFKLKKDSIGSIFVASDDELIFTKVISSVDRRGDDVIIIGHDTWIEKPSMDLDKFERLGIILSAPTYNEVLSPEFLRFRKRYAESTGTVPSLNSKTGFECMMFIGQALHQWGSDFINGLTDSDSKRGVLGRTYQLSESQCNKTVPFVIFRDGVLQLVEE